MYINMKKTCKEHGTRFLSVLDSDRSRGNGHKLEHRRRSLNHQETFTVRVTKEPREVVKSLSLETPRKPSGHRTEQPALGDSAWPKELNTINPQRSHLTSPTHKKKESQHKHSIFQYQLSKSYNSHSKTMVFPQSLLCSIPFASSIQAPSIDYIPRSSTRSSWLYIKLKVKTMRIKKKESLYSIRKIFDISAYIQ